MVGIPGFPIARIHVFPYTVIIRHHAKGWDFMNTAQERLRNLGVGIPDILVPKQGIDLKKWAVVACDQYTSEPGYWERVENFVANEPSTLHLVYPEVYLEEPDGEKRIGRINATMASYVKQDIFETYEKSFFLVHRTTGAGPGRWGLIISLDLERYDYAKDSRTLIRATEGTILSRIPPRKLIRKDAPLELPHILVLVNDEKKLLIEPLVQIRDSLESVYDTDLMESGGHISAWRIAHESLLGEIATAFEQLHGALDPSNPLLFAMGDGNHSLATAKSCWEDIKRGLSDSERETHPARYALVEIENIYDPGLIFEPIHRVLFKTSRDQFLAELALHCTSYQMEHVEDMETLEHIIGRTGGLQRFGYVDSDGLKVIALTEAQASIPAGTLQAVIDALLTKGAQVDYIHGEEITRALGSRTGNIGLFLPALDKHAFFDTIIADGALPRKTFSMGEAHEKRFYLEARKIT